MSSLENIQDLKGKSGREFGYNDLAVLIAFYNNHKDNPDPVMAVLYNSDKCTVENVTKYLKLIYEADYIQHKFSEKEVQTYFDKLKNQYIIENLAFNIELKKDFGQNDKKYPYDISGPYNKQEIVDNIDDLVSDNLDKDVFELFNP